MTLRFFLLIFLFFAVPLSWGAGIYPSSVEKLPSVELGQAVLLLIPEKGSDDFVGWDLLSEGPIEWLDEGYVPNAKDMQSKRAYLRRGLMRINILGKKSTVLKKRKQELAWQVTYSNWGNPAFGVDLITLEPGTSDQICFFSNTDGCALDPIPSLKASGFSVKRICAPSAYKTGYKLSHAKRKTIYANIIHHSGSGGISVYITLWVKGGESEVCNDEDSEG